MGPLLADVAEYTPGVTRGGERKDGEREGGV